MAAPEPVRPLSVSWREWLQAPDWHGERWLGPAFDAIVVGSGYGGSVAALRLAQKHYRVLLLERGSEYLPGEFPNDFSLVPKFFRLNVPGQGTPVGRATGLIEAHIGEGMVGITGNGLGGGSLVNAGVAMQPDADVFAQAAWPAAIRNGREPGGLQRWFEFARGPLGIHAWDSQLPQGGTLCKTVALQGLGGKLGREAKTVDLTIDPAACQRCGDCASGCNVPGAKKSLDHTYLREALATGMVQVVTQAEVYRFEPAIDPATGHGAGWLVHAFATDAQQQFLATEHVFTEKGPAGTARKLSAPMLFICAGTFGSTQLLQRSQERSGGSLAFSRALGTRVSGNGDSISWLVGEKKPVSAVGLGQRGFDAWQAARQDPKVPAQDIVGPTITALIDLRTRADGDRREPKALPLDQRVVIEDGAVPRAIAQVFRELLATAGTLKQLDTWWFRRHGAAPGEDPLAASASQAQHAQTLLAMGHDGSPARIVWLEGQDCSAPYLPKPEELATYARQQEIFDKFGSRHVHSPLWQPMPESALRLMSGAKPPRTVLTVHPLGGCVMGDDPEASVVNDRGQVWVRDPGAPGRRRDTIEPVPEAHGLANEPHLYRNLYVLDGSIVPSSLGCNPLWTITALAERALHAIPRKPIPSSHAEVMHGADRTPQAFPSRDLKIEARLNERLLAPEAEIRGPLASLFKSGRVAARFDAVFHSGDMVGDLVKERHTIRADATLCIAPAGAATNECLRYHAEQGEFDALPATRWSWGKLLLLRAASEALLVIPLGVLGWKLGRWWGVAAGVALWVVLVALFPLGRTALTWFNLRGCRDMLDALRNRTFFTYLTSGGSLIQQLIHASEVRVMQYRLKFKLQAAAPGFESAPTELTLLARKRVMYRASLPELFKWLQTPFERTADGQRVFRPLRASLWEQVMNADVRVVMGAGGWGSKWLLRGCFAMGFENLTASGLAAARRGAKGPMELGLTGDTTTGMLALAGYPLLFLRYAFKTRLLDARLPTYSQVPRPDAAPWEETSLRAGDCSILPDLYRLQVPRGCGPNDVRDDSTAPLELALRRYRRIDAEGNPVKPTLVEGTWQGQSVVRAKAVLLVHAFAQSGLCFTLKTVRKNLAEAFYEKGYEVWILESRMSTRSGYADEPFSLDQIGKYDIPAAVRQMVTTLTDECQPAHPLQVSAFAQCLGSASLWMAALSGALRHDPNDPVQDDEARPCLSLLSHAMFSQVHPWVVGARSTQSKTWLPSLLQAVWRRGAIPFAVRGAQDGFVLPLMDRVLATMPVPVVEGRRSSGHEDAAASCRRIRFIEAPLFKHENINDATFDQMNLLFGDANLRTFAHARRFVDRERLVDEDGVNCYVTRHNLVRHLAFPVQLLHGRENELFDACSVERSFRALRPTQATFQDRFCKDDNGHVGPIVVDGHGHVDVLIGAQADQLVFPRVLRFFEACVHEPVHAREVLPTQGWRARAPRVGPFLGWLRRDHGRLLLRISFVIDDRNSSDAHALPCIRVRFRHAPCEAFQTLDLPPGTWQLATGSRRGGSAEPRVQRLAWADLPLDAAAGATEWQLLSMHASWSQGDDLPLVRPAGDDDVLHSCEPTDRELNEWLARHARPRDALGPLQPPLALDVSVDEAATLFHLPANSVESLARGHALRLAVSCCRHPGLGIDRGRVDTCAREFLAAQQDTPVDFALLVGDQIYADATAGLVDPTSPLERYHERHAQAFDREGLGALLARLPVYLTPDDHEWIDGYPAGSPLVKDPWPDWQAGSDFRRHQQQVARIANRAVSEFQRLQSPLGGRARPRYTFEHGCARFFVIDSRFARRRDAPVIVSRGMFASLQRWLARPGAADMLNVIVCGSVVMPGLRINADPANPGPIDTWQYARCQRKELLRVLVENVPRRFVLLSGDYHVSGAGLLEHAGGIVGAAIVAPPLYAPMPYANASPEMVDTEDAVWLGVQREWVHFRASPGAEFARGSGLAVLEAQRQPDGGFCVRFQRELRVWESGTVERHDAMLCLPAQAPAAAAVSAPSSPAPAGP